MSADIYLCSACETHHCHDCNPDVCDHGNQLCSDTAAEYCGQCLTDMAWDRANVVAIDRARGK